MIGAAGGHAHVWGLSSGAVLALEAAAAGVTIVRLAVQEPPLVVDPADRRPPVDLRRRVSELIVQTGRPLPAGQWAAVTIPVLVMCGTGKETPAWFSHAAQAVAGALPDGHLLVRRGLGHTKKLDARAIAAALTGFLTGSTPATQTGEHHE